MPYHLESAGSKGYYVVSTDTGKRHSSTPLTKVVAESQLKALYAAMKRSGEKMPKRKK